MHIQPRIKSKTGVRTFIRRTHRLRRGKWLVMLCIAVLIFVCFCIFTWPNTNMGDLQQLTNPVFIPSISYSEFIDLALRFVVQDIQAENLRSSRTELCRVCRCALSTPRMTAACAVALVNDISVDSLETTRRKKEQCSGVVLPPDQPNALRRCRLKGEETLINDTMTFFHGTDKNILEAIPRQVEKMRRKAEVYSLRFPPLMDLLGAVSSADERDGVINAHAFCDSTPKISASEGSYLSEFESVTSDIQVLSTTYLFLHMRNLVSWDDKLITVLYGSHITYLIWDHWRFPEVDPNPQVLHTFFSKLMEVIEKKCEVTKLKGDYYEGQGTSQSLFIGIRVKYSTTRFLGWNKVKETSQWNSFNAEDVQLIQSNHVLRQPLLCENFRHALVLSKVIKYGTKTAVFMGSWKGKDVLVKLLHPYQYFSFEGFRKFMENDTVRTPLIHYPSFSCYSSTYMAIFQVQSFLSGFQTLQSVMRLAEVRNDLPLVNRVEIAIQIVCVFHFLHEQHSAGFFVYDDNHPRQYLLKKSTDGSYVVRVIDIDTLQLGIQDDGNRDEVKKLVPYPYGNITTRCRCFYCRGRSSCQFFNTLESYEACGQVSDPKTWRSERPKLMNHSYHCTGSSDVWFEAQLLYFLFEGKIAWFRKDRKDLLEDIRSETMPSFSLNIANGKQTWKALRDLLSHMFLDRPREETVLQSLLAICTQLGCRHANCPAVFSVRDESYSSPLFAPLG